MCIIIFINIIIDDHKRQNIKQERHIDDKADKYNHLLFKLYEYDERTYVKKVHQLFKIAVHL